MDLESRCLSLLATCFIRSRIKTLSDKVKYIKAGLAIELLNSTAYEEGDEFGGKNRSGFANLLLIMYRDLEHMQAIIVHRPQNDHPHTFAPSSISFPFELRSQKRRMLS